MTKQQAGALGGRATVAKHGRQHMAEIGARGAEVTWQRYQLHPAGESGWVMVDRTTNEVKAVINYLPGR